jgi:hypothetical protein
MIRYLRSLNAGRMILWCYFIWYLVVLVRYFDPNHRIWVTALGLAGIVGVALYVNSAMSGRTRVRLGFWPVLRMFMMPFCVSSYSALVKGQGFWLGIFSRNPWEVGVAVGMCVMFWGMATVAKAAR